MKFNNPNYPSTVCCPTNTVTVQAIQDTGSRHIAELGILDGSTSLEIARHLKTLSGATSFHLFDFEHNVKTVAAKIRAEIGYTNIVECPCTIQVMDSYNWPLMKMIEDNEKGEIFDYVFLDGAHTWAVDALAFLLLDKLLKKGGYIDFDDYDWTLETSVTMAPNLFPKTLEFYSEEQIRVPHIKKVVDLLVRRDPRYQQVIAEKLFRKRKGFSFSFFF
jgi:predicted O-methyltransferase YrrM